MVLPTRSTRGRRAASPTNELVENSNNDDVIIVNEESGSDDEMISDEGDDVNEDNDRPKKKSKNNQIITPTKRLSRKTPLKTKPPSPVTVEDDNNTTTPKRKRKEASPPKTPTTEPTSPVLTRRSTKKSTVEDSKQPLSSRNSKTKRLNKLSKSNDDNDNGNEDNEDNEYNEDNDNDNDNDNNIINISPTLKDQTITNVNTNKSQYTSTNVNKELQNKLLEEAKETERINLESLKKMIIKPNKSSSYLNNNNSNNSNNNNSFKTNKNEPRVIYLSNNLLTSITFTDGHLPQCLGSKTNTIITTALLSNSPDILIPKSISEPPISPEISSINNHSNNNSFIKPVLKCTITGLPAKYIEPKSKLPYANIEAYKQIKERNLIEQQQQQQISQVIPKKSKINIPIISPTTSFLKSHK